MALKPNKLVGLTDGELADSWGALKARADSVDEQIEALKALFEDRKLDVAKGEHFRVVKDVSEQSRIDTKALRADLGAGVAKYEKTQTRTVYQVRPVVKAAAA